MRLIDTAAGLLVYFLAATFVAQLIVAAYVYSAWQLDGPKIAHIVAVARGAEPLPSADPDEAAEPLPPEEPSFEAVVDRRARLFRDLELREQALAEALGQLAFERRQLDDQRTRQQQLVSQFEQQLQAVKDGAQTEGIEVVRGTLQSLKPDQAKEQLAQMLERDELDEVVLLLAELPTSNRAKILAEFKTPDDSERLAEILRRIRIGAPEAPLADQAMNRLNEPESILR